MDRKDAEQLLDRYRAGTCTDGERRLVEAWFNQELAFHGLDADVDWEVAESAIWNRVEPPKRLPISKWLPYVAAVIVAMATGTWYFASHRPMEGSEVVSLEEVDVAPGGNRATLTLADGRKIPLDEAQGGIVIRNSEITYSDGNQLADIDGSDMQSSSRLLEVSTPKGGTYQITLPDGSRVWLNAASKLQYPAQFDGDERLIALEGEAYFDIVPMQKADDLTKQTLDVPFKVVTNSQTVHVLGTEFNISAYADDGETKTTLVAGKVRVAATERSASHAEPAVSELEPGQQATTRGSRLEIRNVDVFDYTAWREGMIVLNGARLTDVMRQVERWYDVTIEVSALKANKTAYVVINRNENLSSVLKALEETYQVEFKLKGRRVGSID